MLQKIGAYIYHHDLFSEISREEIESFLILYVQSICRLFEWSRHSSVNRVTWLRAGQQKKYSFYDRSNRKSVPQNFQIENGTRAKFIQRVPWGHFPLEQSGRDVKFTAYHHPRPRIEICGAESPIPDTPHRIIKELMTNELQNSYNQFLFHSFLSALHVSNESSRSSSGARHNILYYTVWYNRAGESRLACTIVPIVPIVLCNTVHYAVS